MKTAGFLILIVLFPLSAVSFPEVTSITYNGGAISLSQPEVEVDHVYGVGLTNKDRTLSVKKGGKYAYFPHTIENLSNISNNIDIEVKMIGSANDWSASLVDDVNGDGKHQSSENNIVPSRIKMAESSRRMVFLRIKVPDNAAAGSKVSASLRVVSEGRVSKPYVGYNGVTYGGNSEEISTDTVVVE